MDNTHVDIPHHISIMNVDELVARLKVDADELLTSNRVYVNDSLYRTRHEINHIIGQLSILHQREVNLLNDARRHAVEALEMMQDEKGVTDGLLRELQERYDQLGERNKQLQKRQEDDRKNFDLVQDDLLNRQRRIRDNLLQRINRLTGERNNANVQLGIANIQLGNANNQLQAERFNNRRILRRNAGLRILVHQFRIRQNPAPINNPPISWLLLH